MKHQAIVLILQIPTPFSSPFQVALHAAVLEFPKNELEITPVAAEAVTNTVPVLIVQSDSVDEAATAVTAGGSTVIVWVEMQGVDVEAAATTAADVVSATATTPADVAVEEAGMMLLERIEPVTVTVTGTLEQDEKGTIREDSSTNLTVAVIVVGMAEAVAVEAALEQESFCLVHKSSENPAAVMPTQAVNWCPQDAAAADARSSKSSSKTEN